MGMFSGGMGPHFLIALLTLLSCSQGVNRQWQRDVWPSSILSPIVIIIVNIFIIMLAYYLPLSSWMAATCYQIRAHYNCIANLNANPDILWFWSSWRYGDHADSRHWQLGGWYWISRTHFLPTLPLRPLPPASIIILYPDGDDNNHHISSSFHHHHCHRDADTWCVICNDGAPSAINLLLFAKNSLPSSPQSGFIASLSLRFEISQFTQNL